MEKASTSRPILQRPATALTAVLAVAFALRLLAAIVLPDQGAALPDTISYRDAGHLLWSTGHLGSPYHMPLYPALVASLGPGWGQILIDITLSTAAVWLVYRLAELIFADLRIALLAAAAVAIYPYLIFYSVVGLSETLFITLLLAAYVCWYREWNAAAACFAVLAILTRPVLDLIAPILVVVFTLVVHRRSIGTAIRNLAVYAAIYCALMAPWWLHNYQTYGSFVRLNLGTGMALLSGNNPRNLSGGMDTDLGTSLAPFNSIADPVARDRAIRDAAIGYIKADPARFLEQSVRKFAYFWRLWPNTESYSGRLYVAVAILSFTPVLLLALIYLALDGRKHWRRITPLVLFGCYLTAIHMVFPGSLRYRLPLEPFLIILAAAGTVQLALRWLSGSAAPAVTLAEPR